MRKEEAAFPKGRIILQQHHGDDWRVAHEFCFYWEERNMTICVWANFLTDQASIPSIVPDFVIANTGPISNGAVPHDMYYKLLGHSKGLPFRCIYDMLSGQYLTKKETDIMFSAANKATGEMSWMSRTLAKLVRLPRGISWRWMTKKEWDKQVIIMNSDST